APARVPRAGTRPAPPRGTPAPRADRAGAPEERGTLRQAVGGTPGPVKVGTRDEIGPAGHPFGSQKRRRQCGSFARLQPPPELPDGLQIEEILGATGGALCALEELEVDDADAMSVQVALLRLPRDLGVPSDPQHLAEEIEVTERRA